jgi:hypothetical protein
VIPLVYKNYTDYGSKPILPVHQTIASLGKELDRFLAEIVGFFCRHTATNLSRATHLESPWADARDSSDNAISQLSLKLFYRSLIEDGEKALSRSELLDSAPEPRWSSFYVAGICWRRMNKHPFYDGVLSNQLSKPQEHRRTFPEGFYAPVKGRDFVEFATDEDVDETIRRVLS